MASQELVPYSDEELREFGLGPYAATATPEGGAIAAGGIIPFTGLELVQSVEGDQTRQLNYEEFERYRKAKSVEPEKTFDEKLGIVGQGLEMVGEEFFGGIWSAVSQGLYITDPVKGIKTLVSGYVRGTNDIFNIVGDVFTKDFYAADTYEKYLEDTGNEDDQDSRQDYIRQLSKDKMRFNLKRAYEVEREKWRTGERKTTLPFVGEMEGEDVAAAEAFGYVGDVTMAVPGLGAFTKLPALAARAAGKAGKLAGKAVGGTGRGVTKITDAVGDKISKVIPEASQTTARVLGIAGSTVAGQPAIGLALAAPTIGRTLDVAGRLGEKVGESLGKRPSQFGVLERIAMDSTVDPNLRKLARILHMGGVGDKLLSGTGTLALGVGTGMVVGGGLGYLAQGEEGMLQGLGAGIGIGGPAALGGAGLSKLTGHARRSAEDADVMRFLEAQAKKGVDPKQALAKLGRDALLKTATLERIFQGDVAVNLLTNAQYNKAHKAGAAAWSPDRKSIDINIEASDAKHNILHEFGHALWDSPVVNKSEMTAELVGVYGQTRIDAMATGYVERLAENRVRRRFKKPFSKAADNAVQRWKEGKPIKGVDDFDVAVNAERADLTKQFGLDWVHSEIFAEDFVGSTLDRNLNKLRKGKTGEGLFHLRGAMLRTKAGILRKMGVKVDPLGRVDGAYASRIFGEMTGDKKFKKTLRNYVRDRGRHFDEMGRRAKNPDGAGSKRDILNMGDHAGFWRDKGDGTFENDYATKNAKGEVTVKGHEEIAKTLHDRAEGVRRLRDGLVAKGLIGRDDKSTLGAREGADGSIEVTGKAIPDEVIEASNLPPQMKAHLKLLNELVGNGTTAMVWYNGISTTKSKKIKMNEVVKTTKDGTPDLRGTTRMWRRNLRKFMGNIAASRRDIKPFEYRITKEGNITVQSLDVDAIHDKVSRWQKDTDANGRPKLELWGNDVKKFYEDLKVYMDNHRKGLGGAEGIGEAKRNAFRAFLMRDMTGSGGVSPLHDILNNRPVDRTSIVKSFRLDRIGSVESTMRDDFHFDYHKVKENLMPDGTPKVKEHGEVIEFNEAMVERFMPVAPVGARYMDLRDMQGEKMIGLAIDRLGHGVRTLASGASSEIAAQGGRAFMWLEGKWASYQSKVFESLINQMKLVGTEYLALSVLGDLNHNNTRYGMRLFGESIRDAVTRGDITSKQANAYIELMTSNAANIDKMKKKPQAQQRETLQGIRKVQQFIDAVDAGDLTHIAGEVLTEQRKTKGAKFNFSREEAEQLQFGPRSTAEMAVDGGLWDEKKFPLGTVVAVMKIKHNMGSPKYDAANDIPIVHEPNLHYHYGFTVDVEPVAYAKTFYPLSSLSRGKSRAIDKKTGKLTGGNVFNKAGSVGPQPLQSIMPELDLLTEGKMGPPIAHPVNYMPETHWANRHPKMIEARKQGVMGEAWSKLVDKYKPVLLSPKPTKNNLVPDRPSEKSQKDDVMKLSLQMLRGDKPQLIGAARELPEGTLVGGRIDIPFHNDTKALYDQGKIDQVGYAVAVHEKGTEGGVGRIIGYDSIMRLKNAVFHVAKHEGTKGDIAQVAVGKKEGGVDKYPLATVEGEYMRTHERGKLKDDAIPYDIYNTDKWIQVGMDPVRHEYFYRKDNHRVPIESASEAILVGDTVFVRVDDALVQGDKSQSRYFPAETARMEAEYTDAVAKGDVDTMQAAVDQAAARAGYDIGPVYHGRTIPEDGIVPANRPFTEFDPTKNPWGHIMTSDSESVAQSFAGRQMHVGDAYGKLVEGKGDIVKGYLKLDNPFDYRNPSHINDALYAIREWGGEVNVSFEGEKMVKVVDELERRSKGAMEDKVAHEPEFNSRLRKWITSGDYGFFETAGVTELLKKLGHDGYITTERGGTTYAAFESNQIKSADPVTLDDGGNPIPLHDRFNMESDDVRHIPAYHGTPHTFAAEEGAPLGKFSTDKIGTGEGAQSYGHGLYFAEKKSVAEWYRDKLTDNRNLVTHSNVDVKLKNKNLKELGEQGFSQIRTWVNDFVVGRARYNSKRTSVARAKQYLKEELIPKFKKSAEWDVGLWTSNIEIHGEKDFNKAKLADAKKALSAVESLKPDDFDIEIDQPVVGSMYEVDITPKEEHFLDLDKPFKEQSKYVKDALLKDGKRVFDAETGSDLYLSDFVNNGGQGLHFLRNLEAVSGRPSDVSAKLANIGIAGNRFADASSRATTSMGKPKEGFKQTYNYVVFEDSAVEIRNRYMPRVSEDGKVVTMPTKGRIVQTGPKKFRAYNLSGKLMGVAATQAAADALLDRGKN
jgi:hypothetical protein